MKEVLIPSGDDLTVEISAPRTSSGISDRASTVVKDILAKFRECGGSAAKDRIAEKLFYSPEHPVFRLAWSRLVDAGRLVCVGEDIWTLQGK